MTSSFLVRILILLMLGGAPGVFAQPGLPLQPVYVVSHGLHAGIVLPNPALTPAGSTWPVVFPEAVWLEIGWGDGKYYPKSDSGPLLAIRALMVPTASVLQVVAVPQPVQSFLPAGQMVELQFTSAQVERLAESIASVFVRDAGGKPIDRGPGLYGNSRFYAAHGKFHLFHNCNHWVLERLKDAGLDLDGAGALTGDGLLKMLREQTPIKDGDSLDD